MTSISQASLFQGAQFAGQRQPPSIDDFQKQISRDFGEEAASKIVKNGKVDVDALNQLFESQGITPPPGGLPPGGFGIGGAGGPQDGSVSGRGIGTGLGAGGIDTSKILDLFSNDFGDEEASKVTDEKGNLDFAKLKDYLDERIKAFDAPINTYNNEGTAEQLDLSTLFGDSTTNNSQGSENIQDQLLKLLFQNNQQGNNVSASGLFANFYA